MPTFENLNCIIKIGVGGASVFCLSPKKVAAGQRKCLETPQPKPGVPYRLGAALPPPPVR
jgi:hypothetical protein